MQNNLSMILWSKHHNYIDGIQQNFKNFPSKINKSIFPPRRSEIIYNKNNKVIIIDYAHSKMLTKIY